MLTIRLLGGASIEGVQGPLTGRAVQRKPMALLTILAADRSRSISRDRLMVLLAPELDADRARHLIRDNVYALRSALGQESITSAGDELRLERGVCDCDLWQFHAALEAGELERAASLRVGPFLDGFHLRDSPEFDAWAAAERDRIDGQYAEALESLAAQESENNNAAKASRRWTERLALDPLSSRATLGLMRALEASGDVPGALRRAAIHAALVQAELGGPPDPAVVAEVERLRRAPITAIVESEAPPAAPTIAPVDRSVAHRPGGSEPPDPPEKDADSSRRASVFRRPGWALAAAALLALAFVGARAFRAPSPTPDIILEPRRVAVLPFRNATGDASLDPIGPMVADWITQGLSEPGFVEVVSVMTVLGANRFSGTVSVQQSDIEQSIARAASGTGAGTVVHGAYYREGDVLLVQAQITDAVRGVVIKALEPVRTSVSTPLRAIEDVRRLTLLGLAPLLDSRLSASAGLVSTPPSYPAYRDYAEGMEHFVQGNFREAATRFERAAAGDTSYVTPLLWAALARWNSGDHVGGDSVARAVEARQVRLAPLDDAIMRSIRAWASGNWSAAYDAALRASRLAPGAGFARVQVAVEARRMNRLREAREILVGLDPDRGELEGWTFYWNDLADVHHLFGDHVAESRAAAEALRRFPEDVTARLLELRALAARGEQAKVQQRLDDVLVSPVSRMFGALAREAAYELAAHGAEEHAVRVMERALRWYEDRMSGTPGGEPGTVRGMVRPMLMLGKYTDAITILDGLAAPATAPASVDHYGQRALLAQLTGEPADADRRLSDLAARNMPFANGRTQWWHAAVLGVRGECDAGLSMLRDALGAGVEFGMELHHAWELASLRSCPGWAALVRAR